MAKWHHHARGTPTEINTHGTAQLENERSKSDTWRDINLVNPKWRCRLTRAGKISWRVSALLVFIRKRFQFSSTKLALSWKDPVNCFKFNFQLFSTSGACQLMLRNAITKSVQRFREGKVPQLTRARKNFLLSVLNRKDSRNPTAKFGWN